jgi:predicted O-methyltransferase YrrM
VLHSFEISKRAKAARGHLARYGYDAFAHVHQVRSTSREASAIRDRIALIDAILIDGDHSFEGSYADFLFWADGVRPGGFLIFHDVSEEFEKTYEDVGMRSVYSTIQTIEKKHPGFAILRMIPPHYHNTTSMAVVQKTTSSPVNKERSSTLTVSTDPSIWTKADRGAMRAREWESVNLPAANYPPSMLQADEFKYLYWLARDVAGNNGAVVELGAWQGGSTAVLSQGVRDRPSANGPSRVHTFDRFIWDEYAGQCSPHVRLQPGDDMLGLFQENVEPWSDLVVAHKGELIEATWDPNDKISLLFVDAPKEPRALQASWNTFGPALNEGSVVVFQDFKHWLACFLPVYVPLLSGLRPLHVCRDGCSVAFRFTGPFAPITLPPMEPSLVDQRYRQTCEALSWDPPTAVALELSWAMQLLHLGRYDEAQTHYERVKDRPVCAGAADAPQAVAGRLEVSV